MVSMNAVIGVGQFCEIHGPCLLFCTQTVLEYQKEAIDEFELDEEDRTITSLAKCDGCSSIGIGQAFVTKDSNEVNYISTQTPRKKLLRRHLRQSCIRSLSCEIGANSKSEDGCTMCFCDSDRGGYTVLCYTWRVLDSQARGFYRWITIVLLMKDRFMLMTTWPFFIKHIEELVKHLQCEAKKVYEAEQITESTRAARLKAGRAPSCAPRNIAQLTGLTEIWNLFHNRFAWVLHNAPKSLQIVPAPSNVTRIPKLVESAKTYRDLLEKLSTDGLSSLCYCLSTGIQVVLRGSEYETAQYVNLLSNLIPYGNLYINGCSSYLRPEECCLLGVSLSVALPKSSVEVYRIDMLDSGWVIKWEGKPPDKINKFTSALVRAASNENLNVPTTNAHVRSLVLQWHNTAKTLSLTGSNWMNNKSLLRTLSVGEEDFSMVAYFISSLKSSNGS